MATHPVPTTYDELHRNFGAFIASEIRRYNRDDTHAKDAFQDVFYHLLVSKVIEKFHAMHEDQVTSSVPATMTVPEVLLFFGIKFTQWRSAMWNFHSGRPQSDGTLKFGKWMPTPINTEQLKRRKPSKKSQQSTDGYSNQKAIFKGEDIVNLQARLRQDSAVTGVTGYWKNPQVGALVQKPKPAPTPYHFLNYLGMAVRRHFWNYGRTLKRKWKESPGDMMPGKRLLGADAPQFHTAEGGYNTCWAESIVDDRSGVYHMDGRVELAQTLSKLAARGVNITECRSIVDLMADGYMLTEAINKSSLTDAQKRACVRELVSVGT